MIAKQGFGQTNTQRLGWAAVFGRIFVPVIFIALINSNSSQFAILRLQLSMGTYEPSSSTKENEGGSKQTGANLTSLPIQLRVVQEKEINYSSKDINNEPITLPLPLIEKNNANRSNITTAATKVTDQVPVDQHGKQNQTNSTFDIEMAKEQDRNTLVKNQKAEQNYATVSVNTGKEASTNSDKTEVAPDQNEKQVGNESMVQSEKINQDNDNKRTEDRKEDNSILVSSGEESSISNEQREITANLNEKPAGNKSVAGTESLKQDNDKKTEGNKGLQQSNVVCDFSGERSDTCSLLGDIRILPNSSIIVGSPSQSPLTSGNSTYKIRPYSRKWESPVMERIKEVTISPISNSRPTPFCSVNHSVPAVIFSTGGFLGNLFHDFTDVLAPLFATSRQFQGEVQFLVTDFNSKWITKYKPILKQLSRYEVINMDTEALVHCFPEAHVGLLSHKVFGIDPLKTPNGYSMLDFKQFLRSSFTLNKASTNVIPKKSKKKPRLLMILRKGSRAIVNAKEVVAMARSIGFRVITAGPEDTKNLARFTKIVNTCDVMMGVHGAGLANMVFLPSNATLVQVIPWGGLKWASWHDFGEPAPDMGLNYVEYEIKEEESTLIEEYPRDHAVFKDPMSIHRQGWNQLWSIFLDRQKVKLDVGRFRSVLLGIYQSLKK